MTNEGTTTSEYPYYTYNTRSQAVFALRKMQLNELYIPFFVSKTQVEWINNNDTDIKVYVPLTKYNVYYCLRQRDMKLLMKDYCITERINNALP